MHHLRHYALDSKRRRDELFSASVPKSEAMALTFQHKIQAIARFVFTPAHRGERIVGNLMERVSIDDRASPFVLFVSVCSQILLAFSWTFRDVDRH
jgi:hypothetical protein